MKTEFEELPRLVEFRQRTRFKRRARNQTFQHALDHDGSSVSAVVRHLTYEVFAQYMMSEYGLSTEERERIVNDRIEKLPRRFRFLTDYTFFIASIEY